MKIQPLEHDWLTNSWQRCEQAGLRPRRLPELMMLPAFQLSDRRHHNQALITAIETCALPLYQQMCGHTKSRLVVTDAEGVVLKTWGEERLQKTLSPLSLDSGGIWQEDLKGTNAIGTALYELRPVSVIGKQHYLHQLQHISCSASPIFSHQGQVLGILDITSEQTQHDLSMLVLVQNMVQLIENHMLCHLPNAAVRLDIALDKTLLNSGWQGIVIANDAGEIVAHNAIASELSSDMTLLGQDVDGVIQHLSDHLHTHAYELPKPGSQAKSGHTYTAGNTAAIPSDNTALPCDADIAQAWQQANKILFHDVPLLILGETGVGKGEFVKALHQQQPRGPLITINCAALAKELIEAELFGYVGGAFTGADSKGKIGKIRAAQGGILFLDEIGDMPLEAQTRLLSVLQDKVVTPLGSHQSYPVDVQFIAATHQSLPQKIAAGEFREDLYYRLNGLALTLPPLRARTNKRQLIAAIHQRYQSEGQQMSEDLLSQLMRYSWPGNLRELDNTMKVTCLLADDSPILQTKHVPAHLHVSHHLQRSADNGQAHGDAALGSASSTPLKTTLEETLLTTYQATHGNISRTARLLGISRNTLYRRLRALGVLQSPAN